MNAWREGGFFLTLSPSKVMPANLFPYILWCFSAPSLMVAFVETFSLSVCCLCAVVVPNLLGGSRRVRPSNLLALVAKTSQCG